MNKIIKTIIFLITLQLLRIGSKILLFSFINRTIFLDNIVNVSFMVIMTIILLVICKKKNIKLNIFPIKFNKFYVIFSIIVLSIFVITPFITKNYALGDIISLIYHALITVIYEEILFRGLVYKKIPNNEKYKFILSSILFGLWHLGYVDSVIYRTSIFSPDANIMKIMIMKAITGTILGLIFGILRYKNKNVYSSMLLHMLINTTGS